MEGDKEAKRYVVPTKQVKSQDDMIKWEKSEAYQVQYITYNHLQARVRKNRSLLFQGILGIYTDDR